MEGSGPTGPRDKKTSAAEAASQLMELRDLLTGPEQRQLSQIVERLNDPVRQAREISEALPDALSLGSSRDGRIARALQPTVDAALKSSVQKNPKVIADAIFPALGPAIRKAISATLLGMVQSLNLILNQSFSLRGLRWRLEAYRTRRSFAEIVLLHTLVYRVEQVYLIHRHSGVLLQHASSDQTDNKDPDLVSGMLTAIQDFVKDSFDSRTGEVLDTLRMDGDHSVWIEHGSEAIMAAVIRGTPPVDLRDRFRELLDGIHHRFGSILNEFDGNTEPFTMVKPDLEDILLYQVKDTRTAISPLLWVLLAAALSAAIFGSWHAVQRHRNWNAFLSRLRAERGIIITSVDKRNGQHVISGLKDPSIKQIDTLALSPKINPDDVRFQWQPYHALDDASTLLRTQAALDPPSTVQLEVQNNRLIAKGSAAHQWIRQLRHQAPTIPGVDTLDDSQLQDHELSGMVSAIADLESQVIYFNRGESVLTEEHRGSMSAALDLLRKIQELSRTMDTTVKIAIIGQADASGSHRLNLQLSRQRAHSVMSFMVNDGIDPIHLNIIGTGAKIPVTTLQKAKTLGVFRSVTFKAFMEYD